MNAVLGSPSQLLLKSFGGCFSHPVSVYFITHTMSALHQPSMWDMCRPRSL